MSSISIFSLHAVIILYVFECVCEYDQHIYIPSSVRALWFHLLGVPQNNTRHFPQGRMFNVITSINLTIWATFIIYSILALITWVIFSLLLNICFFQYALKHFKGMWIHSIYAQHLCGCHIPTLTHGCHILKNHRQPLCSHSLSIHMCFESQRL